MLLTSSITLVELLHRALVKEWRENTPAACQPAGACVYASVLLNRHLVLAERTNRA